MRKFYIGILAALSLMLFAACAGHDYRYAQEYRWVFDTRVSVAVHYYGTEGGRDFRQHRDIASEAADLVYQFDKLFNRFDPESDIYRINYAGGEWVEVNEHTMSILQQGIAFRLMSNGRVDITIGAVMDLWDFGFYSEHLVPSQADIDRALETIGADIYFDIENNRVRLSNPDSRIDLGALAKGYAADYVAEFLHAQGVSAIVNFQGDIRLVGNHPEHGVWGLGISDPHGGPLAEPILGVQVPGGYASVTSGTTARGFMQDGRRFHHIMDVDTGWPMVTEFTSITAIAHTALLGEFMVSLIYVTPFEQLNEVIAELGIFAEAIFLDETGGVSWTGGVGMLGEPGVRFPMWAVPQ